MARPGGGRVLAPAYLIAVMRCPTRPGGSAPGRRDMAAAILMRERCAGPDVQNTLRPTSAGGIRLLRVGQTQSRVTRAEASIQKKFVPLPEREASL